MFNARKRFKFIIFFKDKTTFFDDDVEKTIKIQLKELFLFTRKFLVATVRRS